MPTVVSDSEEESVSLNTASILLFPRGSVGSSFRDQAPLTGDDAPPLPDHLYGPPADRFRRGQGWLGHVGAYLSASPAHADEMAEKFPLLGSGAWRVVVALDASSVLKLELLPAASSRMEQRLARRRLSYLPRPLFSGKVTIHIDGLEETTLHALRVERLGDFTALSNRYSATTIFTALLWIVADATLGALRPKDLGPNNLGMRPDGQMVILDAGNWEAATPEQNVSCAGEGRWAAFPGKDKIRGVWCLGASILEAGAAPFQDIIFRADRDCERLCRELSSLIPAEDVAILGQAR